MARNPRLGRPPDADSNMTRERILDVARTLFAERGYDNTSNRQIADEAGLTTGAIYHYFDRKLDIFTAVYRETQRVVYEQLEKDIAAAPSFVLKLRAVLESAHELNNADPSIAQFLGSCRIDAQRNVDVARALTKFDDDRQAKFFSELVSYGVMTGEVDEAQRSEVAAVIRTITIGLVDGVSGDREWHRRAVDGLVALFEGSLIQQLEPDDL